MSSHKHKVVEKETWFPSSPERDHLESVLCALAAAMGYVGYDRIVQDYLDGKSIMSRIGRHGVWHFNNMTRVCGMKPPESEVVTSDGVCEDCERKPTGTDGRAAFCKAHR